MCAIITGSIGGHKRVGILHSQSFIHVTSVAEATAVSQQASTAACSQSSSLAAIWHACQQAAPGLHRAQCASVLSKGASIYKNTQRHYVGQHNRAVETGQMI
jgi:hypothetical protein